MGSYEFDMVPREKGIKAIALAVHKANKDLIGRGLVYNPKMSAMNVYWIIMRAFKLAVFNLDKPPTS